MRVLDVRKPSTLHLSLNDRCNYFCLTNKKGQNIYERFVGNEKNIKVNLKHKGQYKSNESFDLIFSEDLKIKKPNFELPKPERNRYKKFEIVFNEDLTGTPARIFTHLGLIEIGKEFDNFTPQTKLFILLHELGHYFYKTEWKTDMFAFYHYVSLGFNVSQAFYSLSKILRDNPQNNNRIARLFNTIKQYQNNE